jgi:hypothetical protein
MPSTKTPRRSKVEKAWHDRGLTSMMERRTVSPGLNGNVVKGGAGYPKRATANPTTDGRGAYSGASSRTRGRANGEWGAYDAAMRLKQNYATTNSRGMGKGPKSRSKRKK